MLEVLRPGMMSTLQDVGRVGYRKIGIPVCGWLDAYSAQLTNIGAGNKPESPIVEMIGVGGHFEFSKAGTCCVGGADMSATLSSLPVPLYEAFEVRKGDRLVFGQSTKGSVTYLAVAGQWNLTPCLDSISTFIKADLGGLKGRPLQKGDSVDINPSSNKTISIPAQFIPHFEQPRKVRILSGPEATPQILTQLKECSFYISKNKDRMGLRLLSQPALELTKGEMLSAPVTKGTMQVPPDGHPIVMLADGQTTGGYPRVGQVADFDISYLVQQPPGNRITFKLISLDEAIRLSDYQKSLFDSLSK